jgi:hypothetical protein
MAKSRWITRSEVSRDAVPVGDEHQLLTVRDGLRPVQRQRGLVGERRQQLRLVSAERFAAGLEDHQQDAGVDEVGAQRHQYDGAQVPAGHHDQLGVRIRLIDLLLEPLGEDAEGVGVRPGRRLDRVTAMAPLHHGRRQSVSDPKGTLHDAAQSGVELDRRL